MINFDNVPMEVVDHISAYLKAENLGELVEVTRASDHPDDDYLYEVIAKKGDNYSVWTCWNETTGSLNFGHYGVPSLDEAKEIVAQYYHHTMYA